MILQRRDFIASRNGMIDIFLAYFAEGTHVNNPDWRDPNRLHTEKGSKDFLFQAFYAERTRFELVVGLPLRQFSKLLVSATHPSLQFER